MYKSQFKISHDETVQITVSRTRTAIQTVCQENSGSEILAIGMEMPGPYREDIEGWQNFPIKSALTKELDIPVYIINDANDSDFAHLWYRSEKVKLKI
jgi:predicted NBD/HSP70 family sugar kinase